MSPLVGDIFRPHGRETSQKLSYFPSLSLTQTPNAILPYPIPNLITVLTSAPCHRDGRRYLVNSTRPVIWAHDTGRQNSPTIVQREKIMNDSMIHYDTL